MCLIRGSADLAHAEAGRGRSRKSTTVHVMCRIGFFAADHSVGRGLLDFVACRTWWQSALSFTRGDNGLETEGLCSEHVIWPAWTLRAAFVGPRTFNRSDRWWGGLVRDMFGQAYPAGQCFETVGEAQRVRDSGNS